MAAVTLFDEPMPVMTIDPPAVPQTKVRRRPGFVKKAVGFAISGVVAVTIVWAAGSHVLRESQLRGCKEHLKQIGVAIGAHMQDHDHLPAPAITAADGTPLLSWRVAILPHLGYRSLYERFHLDEPWDSPHNRVLIHEMPAELACPGLAARRSGQTAYRVFVGPKADMGTVNTPFEPGRGVDIREVTDGTSQTILVFESDTPVIWTKPDELQWTPDGPLPRIRSPHADGTHALFIDGSTRFLKPTIEPRSFRAILTINGGEVVASS
jgi:Protein of unknown function (DUF1559)